MIVLGIESSCDETAVAVVKNSPNPKKRILSNIIYSQTKEHQPYGGVVPEIAARSHLTKIDGLILEAISKAGITHKQLDGVAAAGGPGLIGSLIVGVMSAKTVAMFCDIPFLAVNHLEAHALTARLTDNVEFPYLLILISGGHTQLVVVKGVGDYERLGTTLDDAVGEAFDKSAKIMGLNYPGGPEIERVATKGNPDRFKLPRPMVGRAELNFSFSGLKTAVRQQYKLLEHSNITPKDIADLCASFQQAVSDVIMDRCAGAIDVFMKKYPGGSHLVAAGGVASNEHFRWELKKLAKAKKMNLVSPPPILCTDNGAMIAWTGVEKLKRNLIDPMSFAPRPRWSLDGGTL
ncbi:MAG: tRNA (adenosine(37)-N6)-threonylcarbamoyltransferase complex transferase subunit TsaD [Pseudomonadota bacterium]|nr:tRNA (adenosine(37)-N6)-threonylcarbamoyltransferase complex transferase subunit TsaD [Pseudomonadota bacterium]